MPRYRLVRSLPISRQSPEEWTGEDRMSNDGRSVVPQTKMRRAIARAMSLSKSAAPHFYVSTEVTMSAALSALEEVNTGRRREQRASLTALLIRFVALTLAEEPRFNAHYTDEGHVLVDDINVGVAIALDEGLIAPALLDCAGLGVTEISERLRDLSHRAREGRLRAAEMMGATFTVSNLGMYDVSSFAAIVNPPQVAILATGRTMSRPVVVDGDVVVRPVMTTTLSADHRAIDGVDAARFLGLFKARIENPSRLGAEDDV